MFIISYTNIVLKNPKKYVNPCPNQNAQKQSINFENWKVSQSHELQLKMLGPGSHEG